jgi:putative hydrolase of the HAD superfamily
VAAARLSLAHIGVSIVNVVVRAVIFDWFGTLAEWPHGSTSSYPSVFSAHGHRVDPAVFDDYHSRWDGIDHREHSTSREAYLAWSRQRLMDLATECGVADGSRDVLVDALVDVDLRTSMVVFPEVPSVLAELRRRGLTIGVCSNWGWDLEAALRATGVDALIDVAVTSARVGYRKPHAAMYESILGALGVAAPETIFVGDSWEPDVLGPIGAGMRSVHVDRAPARGERAGASPPLVAGASRVSDLRRLLDAGILEGGS